IDLVVGADQGSEGGGGDIGGGAGRGVGGVVGRIGAGDANAADGYGFGRPDGVVCESGAGVTGREAVGGQAVVGQGDRGGRRAVIGLVYPGSRYAQGAGGDVGGRAGG